MSMMRRTRDELDLPGWFGRRLFDWPDLAVDQNDDALKVEEYQEGDTLVVKAEMPGIDPDNDVELSVSDHTLRLKAERRQETKTEDTKGYRSEFHYGAFTRVVALPVGATADDVKATYADGILEVRIPIDVGQAESKKIPITKG
jgi:HSP20 family protein